MDEKQRLTEKQIEAAIKTARCFGVEWTPEQAEAALTKAESATEDFKRRNPMAWQAAEARAEESAQWADLRRRTESNGHDSD